MRRTGADEVGWRNLKAGLILVEAVSPEWNAEADVLEQVVNYGQAYRKIAQGLDRAHDMIEDAFRYGTGYLYSDWL